VKAAEDRATIKAGGVRELARVVDAYTRILEAMDFEARLKRLEGASEPRY
jgi:hypothetical protein